MDHVRYGLSLMNRWSAGENPFTSADWSASWKRTSVSDDEWRELAKQGKDHHAGQGRIQAGCAHLARAA